MAERTGPDLTLYGVIHKIEAMAVEDSLTYVGLLSISGATGEADGLLTVDDALALRDWLNERIAVDQPNA